MSAQSKRNARERQQHSIYRDLPRHASQVRTALFGEWIYAKGGMPIHTTNQYEVARWRSWDKQDVAVLYRKQDGTLTWTLSAAADYRGFLREVFGRE